MDFDLSKCKLLILLKQGIKDPLCDSKTKLAMLREHCRGIVTKEIDAGSFIVLLFTIVDFIVLFSRMLYMLP